MFSIIAKKHRTYMDADPDGSAGGWSAAQVQAAVPAFITQAQADEIIATQGHVGVFLTMAAPEGQ